MGGLSPTIKIQTVNQFVILSFGVDPLNWPSFIEIGAPRDSLVKLTASVKKHTSPMEGGGTPFNGLYGEVPPEKGTFFRLQVYERVGILLDEV